MGRFGTRAAGVMAAASVAGFVAAMALTGPPAVRGQADVVVTAKPCGKAVAGCFDPNRPNEIQVVPGAGRATVEHENLHRRLYGDFDMRYDDECYVSALLYAETGLRDGYNMLGLC